MQIPSLSFKLSYCFHLKRRKCACSFCTGRSAVLKHNCSLPQKCYLFFNRLYFFLPRAHKIIWVARKLTGSVGNWKQTKFLLGLSKTLVQRFYSARYRSLMKPRPLLVSHIFVNCPAGRCAERGHDKQPPGTSPE